MRQDVDPLAQRGPAVTAKPGYARNFLLPKKLPLLATPGNLKTFELHRKVWAAKELREVEGAKSYAAKLSGVTVTVTKKAGEHNALHGSVTSSEGAELLLAKGFEVDRRKILLRKISTWTSASCASIRTRR